MIIPLHFFTPANTIGLIAFEIMTAVTVVAILAIGKGRFWN